jgi:hypothetical protein
MGLVGPESRARSMSLFATNKNPLIIRCIAIVHGGSARADHNFPIANRKADSALDGCNHGVTVELVER